MNSGRAQHQAPKSGLPSTRFKCFFVYLSTYVVLALNTLLQFVVMIRIAQMTEVPLLSSYSKNRPVFAKIQTLMAAKAWTELL